MNLIVTGATNREIGYELGITEQTVKSQVYRIFLRLGTKNRVTAVTIWLQRG